MIAPLPNLCSPSPFVLAPLPLRTLALPFRSPSLLLSPHSRKKAGTISLLPRRLLVSVLVPSHLSQPLPSLPTLRPLPRPSAHPSRKRCLLSLPHTRLLAPHHLRLLYLLRPSLALPRPRSLPLSVLRNLSLTVPRTLKTAFVLMPPTSMCCSSTCTSTPSFLRVNRSSPSVILALSVLSSICTRIAQSLSCPSIVLSSTSPSVASSLSRMSRLTQLPLIPLLRTRIPHSPLASIAPVSNRLPTLPELRLPELRLSRHPVRRARLCTVLHPPAQQQLAQLSRPPLMLLRSSLLRVSLRFRLCLLSTISHPLRAPCSFERTRLRRSLSVRFSQCIHSSFARPTH